MVMLHLKMVALVTRAGGGDFSSAFSDVFEDLFGDFMGGSSRRGSASSSTRGSDLRYNMTISLEEAYSGKSTTITVPSSVKCEQCSGTGVKMELNHLHVQLVWVWER